MVTLRQRLARARKRVTRVVKKVVAVIKKPPVTARIVKPTPREVARPLPTPTTVRRPTGGVSVTIRRPTRTTGGGRVTVATPVPISRPRITPMGISLLTGATTIEPKARALPVRQTARTVSSRVREIGRTFREPRQTVGRLGTELRRSTRETGRNIATSAGFASDLLSATVLRPASLLPTVETTATGAQLEAVSQRVRGALRPTLREAVPFIGQIGPAGILTPGFLQRGQLVGLAELRRFRRTAKETKALKRERRTQAELT